MAEMIFNSRNKQCKTPFGAVGTDMEFTINFPLPTWVEVNEILLVLRKKDRQFIPMKFLKNENGDNIYTVTMSLPKAGIYWYSFRVFNNFGMWSYGHDEYMNAVCGENLPEWQLTVFDSSYKTPNYAKGGLIYHIFADRFARSGTINTKRKYKIHSNWYDNPEIVDNDGVYRANDFFGGNLKGIIEKLPYLKELGVTIIYLSPIFESSSNHRYDTGDYLKIDELLGTEDDFRLLARKAADFGMSIMLDGVFNHTGADSIYFNKFGSYPSLGAYQSKQSPYYKWYSFQKYPEVYTCWWGCTVVPTVVHQNHTYRQLIMGEVIPKWTALGAKGWRLDVVDELPINFVNELRTSIKNVDSEALIVGEVWEDASTKISYDIQRPYLLGKQLDGVMNYPFRVAILDFVTGGDINVFKNRIWTILENYPRQTVDCLMNMLDTHDTVRAINILSGRDVNGTTKQQRLTELLSPEEYARGKKKLMLAAAIQYTLPGIPSLFYGDEVGVQGYEDPINRRTYPWGREDAELLDFYKKLGRVRTENKAYFTADFSISDVGNVLSYSWGKNGQYITLVVNNDSHWQEYFFTDDGENLLSGHRIMRGKYNIPPQEFLLVKHGR